MIGRQQYLSEDDLRRLQQMWAAQQQAAQQQHRPQGLLGSDAPVSDQNFQSFFEQNGTGGAQGIDRLREGLPQNREFRTPTLQDPREYKTPEYDSLIDPTWLNRRPTDRYF